MADSRLRRGSCPPDSPRAVTKSPSTVVADGPTSRSRCRPGVRRRFVPYLPGKYPATVSHAGVSVLDALVHRYDAIWLGNAANAVFSGLPRLRGTVVALNVDGIERQRAKWGPIGRLWYRLGERLALVFPNAIVADAAVIAEYYWDRYERQTTLIAYGAPILEREPVPNLHTLGLADVEPGRFLLYVSRLEPENQADVVIKAYRAVPGDVPLLIVGDAPHADAFKERLVRLAAGDPRVRLVGAIYGDGYRDLQRSAMAYIHATSVGGTHPALIEAMGAGNLVLAFRTPENAEVLGDGGLLFDDAGELTTQLSRVVGAPDDHEFRHRRDAARERVRDSVLMGRDHDAVRVPFSDPAGRTLSLRLAVWIAFACGIIYLIFVGGGFPGIYDVDLRILSLVALAVTLVGWLVVAWLRPSWQPTTAIWPAFAVSLGALGLATVASPTPRLGLDYLAYSVLLTAGYLLLVRTWADPFMRPRLGALTVAAAIGLSVVYLAVVFARWVDWWGVVGAIVTPPLRPGFEGLTYGNPSAVLTVAVLLVTAAVAYLGIETVKRRAVVATMVVLVLAVILATGSRAGWFAVAVGICLTTVAWLLIAEHRADIRDRLGSRSARAMTGLAVVTAIAILVVMGPVILRRLGAGGEEGRATFFATAVRMFVDAPVLGVGPGGWAAGRIAATQTGEIDYYVPHAHDVYLQTAAESGLVGLLAGLVAVGCLLWLVVGALRDPDPTRRRFGWASFFGIAYFGAHQLLDFYPNMPAALFAFALPIAWLDSTSPRSIAMPWTPMAPAVARVVRVSLLAGVVISVAVLAWSETSALRARTAVDAADRSDWAQALQASRDAHAADPDLPTFAFTLGLAEAASGDYEAARAAMEAATADDLPEAWLDLAAIRQRLGDEAGASQALTEGLRLGVQQPANAIAGAAISLALGNEDAAADALSAAITGVPSLAGDPFWTTDPGFAGIWADTLEHSIVTATPSIAWQLALMSGDDARASAIASGLPANDQVLADLVIAGWGGDRYGAGCTRGQGCRSTARPDDGDMGGEDRGAARGTGARRQVPSVGGWRGWAFGQDCGRDAGRLRAAGRRRDRGCEYGISLAVRLSTARAGRPLGSMASQTDSPLT